MKNIKEKKIQYPDFGEGDSLLSSIVKESFREKFLKQEEEFVKDDLKDFEDLRNKLLLYNESNVENCKSINKFFDKFKELYYILYKTYWSDEIMNIANNILAKYVEYIKEKDLDKGIKMLDVIIVLANNNDLVEIEKYINNLDK